jgi:hypothetical protein
MGIGVGLEYEDRTADAAGYGRSDVATVSGELTNCGRRPFARPG